MMHHLLLENQLLKVAYGCPAANFTQEMTPWNRTFRQVLLELTGDWEKALKQAVAAGKKQGLIKNGVKASDVAFFVMSGYWGIRNFGKLHNSKQPYKSWLRELKIYLKNLS